MKRFFPRVAPCAATFFAKRSASTQTLTHNAEPVRLYSWQDVQKTSKKLQDQYPGQEVTVREHPAGDMGGYWTVEVEKPHAPSMTQCPHQ